ncbi:MAG: hypothetical protein FD145_1240 [Candidatus Saganbacteria bacterium]|uniref:DUF4912 domain-containing protein n=1 Tax=Candidatus Saganbacteria bacterium TaxID=2575572 RepID=A0A833L0B6_UNCSA|nr:MAG: hypothetical protein FD145_1240 [Candidatus Saganbacteria bacterium]
MPLKKKAAEPKVKKTIKKTRRKLVRKPRVKKTAPQKQNIDQEKTPVIQKFDKPFELPQGYNDNRIVIMVRDPYWIFAYWEINGNRFEEIKRELDNKFYGSKLILRVYDAVNWSFFDISISNGANNWYINVGRPNTAYCVDVGFLTSDGTFVCAARSNIVTTPRDGMSNVIDEEWMIPDWGKMYALSGGFRARAGSLEIREMVEMRLREQISSPGISSK